jgi:hypothetical protein
MRHSFLDPGTVPFGRTSSDEAAPPRARPGALTEIRRDGVVVPFTLETIKGADYAFVTATRGT